MRMPAPIVVENVLHQLLHGLLGLLACLGEDRLNVVLADDLAHGALGHLLDRDLRVLDVEEVVLRVLDAPEHDEIDIDDVLVAGQHQAFLGHIAHAAGKAARRHGRAHADLDDVLPRHLRQAHLLDRIGQAEVQTRRLAADRLAEAHDDAELIGIDAEGEGIEGDNRRRHHRQQEHERARQPRAARHHLLELVLAALQQLFQIRLILGAARRSLAPWASAAASAAAAPTLITPGHNVEPFRCRRAGCARPAPPRRQAGTRRAPQPAYC